MKRFLALVICTLIVMTMCVGVAFATGLEDDLSGAKSTEIQSDGQSGGILGDLPEGEEQDIGDILTGQPGMSSEQLQKASDMLSPVTNFIGYLVGIIVIITIAFVGLVTALDLLYIAVPFTRKFLYKAGTDGTGGFTGGMPAGGYGMRGSMAMGVGGATGATAKPTQFVSDEAIACAAMLGGSAQSAMPMGGAMGGMGGYGGYGGMGGMGAAQQQQNMSVKSVIWVYFKKRIFFLIILLIAIMVLTSSAILGTGVNLAKWSIKIINAFNGKIA